MWMKEGDSVAMMELAWLIPLFPLLSFIILLPLRSRPNEFSANIGIFFSLVALVLSITTFIQFLSSSPATYEFVWLKIGEFELTAGIEVNALNVLMLVVVSLVSFLVHVYSKGYMHGDERLPVFYAYLGLFTAAMLALVISPNLLQMYIFWELVGLGSFLLIGYYFKKEEAKQAAKKAFIMTRIGDVGLFIGMILLFYQVGSFEFDEIFQAVASGKISDGMLTLIAILIFVGAIGKSGQFPLHSWLPDAMEGPTPVSALIHAATMVAAGVYLTAVLYPLFAATESALLVVAVVGTFTAIFAATIALVQTDIKRVLAYSTVSQLGFMMLALGTLGYVAAIFHLVTHAFFKALLFLSAGSVIHATGTQNIEEMGGLNKKLKVTHITFFIGALAISGVPLLSGFFSKDEILMSAYVNGNLMFFIIALITSLLTAFYMFRLYFMVFTGEYRGNEKHIHESKQVMTLPMIVLAVLAVFAGYINTPWFGTFLGDWLTEGTSIHSHIDGPVWIMFAAVLVTLGGIFLAYLIYYKRQWSREWLTTSDSGLYRLLYNKYYIDEFYHYTVVWFTKAISITLAWIDRYIINGLVNAVSGLVHSLGRVGSKFQDGQVQTYGAVAFVGAAVLLVLYIWTGGYLQ